MKKVIFITLALISVYGCKKLKNSVDDTETPLSELNQLTAVINGKSFSADSYGTSVNVSNSGLYFMSATATVSTGSPAISLSGKVKTGTYTFGSLPTNETQSATYEINKVKYRALTGTMVIAEIDTLKVLKKLVATFNFKTDTVKGVSYQVTEGNVIFNEN